MTLRAESPQTEQTNSSPPHPSERPPAARVLYLRDDSSANAPLVVKFLPATKPWDTLVREVSCKDEFVRALQLCSWELILVDDPFCGSSGQEALDLCRSVAPEIPAIIIGHSVAEEALETTNQKIDEILSSIQDDFYVLNRDWKFVYANRNFASRIGKKPEDLLGKNLWKVFSKHLGTAYEENLRAAMTKREIREFELRGQYSDAWYHMKVYPSAEGITLINHDITERKRVEEALKRSQAQYKELVESSNSVILRSDKDLNILFMNQYGLRFFGYSAEELIGKNVVGTIIPEHGDAGEDLAGMAKDLKQHPDRYRTNVYQNHRKDGSLVWMSWTNKAIFDEAGSLIEILAIGNDLTQLMEAEMALKASQENLRLMISQASDAMMIVDAHGIIEAVSPLGSRLLGYDESELIGKTAAQFAETFSRLEVALRLEDLRRQAPGPLATSLRIKTKDGAQFMNLSVRLLNCGTRSEKYFMKFSRLDLPSTAPDAAPRTM